ncbi:MAG: hypothetical protein JSW71_22035 [Gemmatimonadota bacterium]|nr:MAG: hypothetical protein JSW71_22035 [Gemmatimonadota bacterium]
MNSTKLLLPLRVPELGPSLGKLASGAQRRTDYLPLDAARYQLATRIIENVGEARRLAANGERSSALEALGRESWQEAWNEAVASVAETLTTRITEHIRAEAKAVRMGSRRQARLGLDEKLQRALSARLGAAGAGLVPVFDSVERHAALALDATALEREAVVAWQEALQLAARRVESAWLDLELVVGQEVTHWLAVGDDVARWRRPLWPVVVVGAVAVAIAAWLGLVFGGYVAPPAWLERVWGWAFPR